MFSPKIRGWKTYRPFQRTARFRGGVEWLEPRALLATIAVTGTGDAIGVDGIVTLREAILSANGNADVNADVVAVGTFGNDTITLPAGTYNLTIPGAGENAGATGDLDITDGLTITGAGAATTIIDAGGIDRVFDISGVNPVSISGVTIRDGNAGTEFSGGGGVRLTSSGNPTPYTVTFTDCLISGNTAVNGGGVNNDDTENNSLVIIRTTVENNTATVSDGSGVNDGGGIVHGPNGAGSLTLTDSIVRNNTAARENGGILAAAGVLGDLTITGSTISGNTAAAGEGGGLSWVGGACVITNSTVSGNTAATDGGGLSLLGNTIAITNSTISGNAAGTDGGGLACFGGPQTLTNVTVTNNVADSDNNGTGNGGGIFNDGSGTVSLLNTIVGGNTDRGGQAPDFSGAITSLGHNLIQSAAGSTITGDTTGNVIGQAPLLGPLADNGGATLTHLPLAGSPAIDAGTSAGAPAADQRGVTRPQGAGVDIGSVEAGAVAAASADLAVIVVGTPNPVSAGGNLAFAIVVTNNGPDSAQAANLSTAIPAGTTFVSLAVPAGWTPATPAAGGTGVVSASIGQFAPGQAVFTLIVHVDPAAAGGSNIVLPVRVGSSTSDPAAGNNAATAVVQVAEQPPAAGNGPTVADVERFGFHAQPTILILTVSSPLALAPTQDRSNFLVVAPGADGQFGTRDDRLIRVSSTRLDATGTVLTIAPSRRLPLRNHFLLLVNGDSPSGLTDRQGRFLDGDHDGIPGGRFVANITRSLLAGPSVLPAHPLRRPPKGPQAHLVKIRGRVPHR